MLPDSSFVSYGYDPAQRLTSITDSLGNSITYTLDGLGNRTKEDTKDPAGTLARTLSRLFDNLARVNELDGALAAEKSAFTYDPQGNLKTSTDPLIHTTANDYDALNRLKKVTQPLVDGQSAPAPSPTLTTPRTTSPRSPTRARSPRATPTRGSMSSRPSRAPIRV